MTVEKINMLEIMLQAGVVVKAVLVLLIVSSIVSWAIILRKKKLFKSVEKCNKLFMDLYVNSTNLKELMQKAETLPFSPFKAMFVEGYQELLKVKEAFEEEGIRTHFKSFGMGVLERALKKGANNANNKLNNFLSLLASIGSISPFIGLFGTVWGIIDSFTGLASGGATIEAVAPGIAEALVATAIGLAAAIPAVLFYNYFQNDVSKINNDMDSFGQEFLNVVERSLRD